MVGILEMLRLRMWIGKVNRLKFAPGVVVIFGILNLLFAGCGVQTADFRKSDRHDGSYPVSPERGNWGFIDTHGKFAINPKFNSGGDFRDGSVIVETSVTPPQVPQKIFVRVYKNGWQDYSLHGSSTEGYSEYSEGLALLKAEDYATKYGYCDIAGNTIIKPKFLKARLFHEGLAAVSNGSRWGYIDKNGKLVIPYRFFLARDFHEGVAAVSSVPDSKEIAFLGKDGVQKLAIDDADNVTDFHEKLSCVSLANNSVQAINHAGQKVFSVENCGDIGEFHNGMCYASKLIDGQKLYGYLNKNGDWAIKPQFYKANNFSESLAAVCVYDAAKVKKFRKELDDFNGTKI